MAIKKCPICGNEPTAICYTSNPPLYGYSHCSIHGGYNKDWHEAELKWNEQVDTRTNADVVEVKHGEWIVDKEGYIHRVNSLKAIKQTTYKCSECGRKSGYNRGLKECPRCGALMDGERKDK